MCIIRCKQIKRNYLVLLYKIFPVDSFNLPCCAVLAPAVEVIHVDCLNQPQMLLLSCSSTSMLVAGSLEVDTISQALSPVAVSLGVVPRLYVSFNPDSLAAKVLLSPSDPWLAEFGSDTKAIE